MMRMTEGWRRRTFTLGAAGVALASVSGCGGSGSSSDGGSPHPATAPRTVAATTRPAATPVVLHGCGGQPVTSPTTFTLACGDGKISLGSLVWSDWGRPTASATGKYLAVGCVPDCASGTEVPYAATVTVSGLLDGGYTVMHISAPHAPSRTADYRLDTQGPVEAR